MSVLGPVARGMAREATTAIGQPAARSPQPTGSWQLSANAIVMAASRPYLLPHTHSVLNSILILLLELDIWQIANAVRERERGRERD